MRGVGSARQEAAGLFIGGHCIKTWSCSQGACALSSAEAEFYAMVEAVCRAGRLRSPAKELGYKSLSEVVGLGADSSAAKSFVRRRGPGKKRHIEVRNLWLQKDLTEGRLVVKKVVGVENPADLMTKVMNMADVVD